MNRIDTCFSRLCCHRNHRFVSKRFTTELIFRHLCNHYSLITITADIFHHRHFASEVVCVSRRQHQTIVGGLRSETL